MTPGDGRVEVSWTVPSSTTGIVGYTVTAAPGGAHCDASGPTATACTVIGLENTTRYTFTVVAHGQSNLDSAPSGSRDGTPSVAPAQPTEAFAEAGIASVTASWTPPAAGSGISRYVVTADTGLATCTAPATAHSCVLGAVAGTPTRVRVVAVGAYGRDSVPSELSNQVTPTGPATPAEPPTNVPLLETDHPAGSPAAPGEQITVTGRGFAPYSSVEVVLYSEPIKLGTVIADEHGDFELTTTIPADLPVGQHTFVALGTDPNGLAHSLTIEVPVAAALPTPGTTASPADPGGLAVTGLMISKLVAFGLALVVVGGGVTAFGRRRRIRR